MVDLLLLHDRLRRRQRGQVIAASHTPSDERADGAAPSEAGAAQLSSPRERMTVVHTSVTTLEVSAKHFELPWRVYSTKPT